MFNNNASNRIIYVPMESVEAYKTAEYWRGYADAIVGYDFQGSSLINDTNGGAGILLYTRVAFFAALAHPHPQAAHRITGIIFNTRDV